MTSPLRTLAFSFEPDDFDQPGTWIPPTKDLQITDLPIDTGVGGRNNTEYVMSDVQCIRLGHVYVTANENWDSIENSVIRYFNTKTSKCVRMPGNKNQHIDFIRKFKIKRKNVYQYIECKKTSGHTIQQPSMIKSSAKQLAALLNNKENKGYKMIPSLYVIVSVDYCSTHKTWVNTFWAMPVIKADDFFVIKSSKYKTFRPRVVDKDNHKLIS